MNYLCLIQEQNEITRKSAINLARENGNENKNGEINSLLDLFIVGGQNDVLGQNHAGSIFWMVKSIEKVNIHL